MMDCAWPCHLFDFVILLQTLDQLPLTDPENFGNPVMLVCNNNVPYISNKVLSYVYVLQMLAMYILLCVQSTYIHMCILVEGYCYCVSLIF